MKKARIETHLGLKINVGNYETVDVAKTIAADVEFETPEELQEKSAKMDKLVSLLVKQEAEILLQETNKKRFMGGVEIGLWDEIKGKAK